MDVETTGVIGTISVALGSAITYAINRVAKKYDNSANAANEGAQKDMLEFMKTQLSSEVERREKVEQMYEQLYEKFNDISKRMAISEAQNERLEHRVAELSDLVASLKGTP